MFHGDAHSSRQTALHRRAASLFYPIVGAVEGKEPFSQSVLRDGRAEMWPVLERSRFAWGYRAVLAAR